MFAIKRLHFNIPGKTGEHGVIMTAYALKVLNLEKSTLTNEKDEKLFCKKHNCDKVFEKNRFVCKSCRSEKAKEYYQKNKLKINEKHSEYVKKNREEVKRYKSDYYYSNKEEISRKKSIYYQENKSSLKEKNTEYVNDNYEKIKEYKRLWFQDNKKKINSKRVEKYNNDTSFRIRDIVSKSIRQGLKLVGCTKNDESCGKYLDYTFNELKNHLESKFESWMTWDNHGVYRVETWDDNDVYTWTWQIDHIIPQSDLLYSSMEDENFKKCWSLNNLRPLSAKQNLFDGLTKVRHTCGGSND